MRGLRSALVLQQGIQVEVRFQSLAPKTRSTNPILPKHAKALRIMPMSGKMRARNYLGRREWKRPERKRVRVQGFRVQGLGLGFRGLGFRVRVQGLMVQGLGLGFRGLGFRGLGLRV